MDDIEHVVALLTWICMTVMMTFFVIAMIMVVVMVVVFASLISWTEIISRVLADQLSRFDFVDVATFSTFLIEQKWILPSIKRKTTILCYVVRKILGLQKNKVLSIFFSYRIDLSIKLFAFYIKKNVGTLKKRGDLEPILPNLVFYLFSYYRF